MLLYQMIRYAEAIQPRAIMMEQVKGLLTAKDLSGKSGGVFESFVAQLEEMDYVPKWRVMLAAQYGVPQLRERVFTLQQRSRMALSSLTLHMTSRKGVIAFSRCSLIPPLESNKRDP